MSRTFHFTILIVAAIATRCYGQSPGSQISPSSAPPRLASQHTQLPPAKALDPKAAFDEFAAALRSKDDQRAADFVSARTLDRYDRCRLVAIDSTGRNFDDFTQLEVMLILQFRYRVAKNELQSMNGRELFCWAIRNNLANTESVNGITIDTVQIDGETAFATLSKDGTPAKGEFFRFVREDRGWKFDLSHVFDAVEPRLAPIRQQASKSRIELAVFLMEKKYGQPIPPEILKGPLR